MARRKSTTAASQTKKAEQPAQPEPITLVGRLCADPVLRRTKSGKAVTTIRVAVNPPEGEATFHSVVVWNRTAEVVCKYMRKGRAVEIVGRPNQRKYDGKDGTERQVDEINAFRVTFVSLNTPAPAEKEVA
jgi:single-strand DNA-binding protein